MFWRERERDAMEQGGEGPCGQVRVLVVGDSADPGEDAFIEFTLSNACCTACGVPRMMWFITSPHTAVTCAHGFTRLGKSVGKTSLIHLIVKGSAIVNPPRTVGCTVSVKLITCGSPGSSSDTIKGDAERGFLVELWDVSGHERYKDCRSLFYTQINGVIFVHDLSQRRTKTSLQKWALEIAAAGTFSSPLGAGGPCGLPVPHLVIGNKVNIAAKEGTRGSSGNLVDAARQWVEKQGLLHSSEALPLTESFPSTGNLLADAKEARYDKERITKFFRMLIRRRYLSHEQPVSNLWCPSQNAVPSTNMISSDDQFIKITSLNDETYNYGTLHPLHAQCNCTPPPTLYTQQPLMMPEAYSFQSLSVILSPESSSAETKRANIKV